jgi:tRNA-specific 2-thiouridylase
MKKVYVGLSGGVDSAVSAAILKSRGFEVVGVFIKIWSPEWLLCTSHEDRLDAMRVAARLNIPFCEIDLTKEYKKEVVDYMIREYKIGRTPNPDVFCNKYIKFGVFFDWAISQGADFVATGHYARVKNEDGIFKMLAGKDKSKDQSYFLWTIGQRQLSKTLFPVGDLEKREVRKLAKKFKLPNAKRKDSQGLCFVGPVDVKDFLAEYVPQEEGDVLDERGNKIGIHPGALFFTIGERHGFTVTKKTPNDEPYFVVAKDMKKNTITVSKNRSESKDICLKNMNWISNPSERNKKYMARVRHLGELTPILFDSGKIFFDTPVTVAAGQSLVIYDGDICLGGGIVD